MSKATETVLGIDIGGTKIAAGVFSYLGELIEMKTVLIEGRKGKEVGRLICQLIEEFLNDSESMEISIESVGICIPGIVNKKKGEVWAPNIKHWENYRLLDEVSKLFPENSNFPIIIESDRSCCILGETWLGVTRGCKDAIFIAVGTGIGAGIMIDGKILEGSNGIAGAIGWMGMEPPYQSKFDAFGNFEYYASGNGLARLAYELYKNKKRDSGSQNLLRKENLTSKDLFKAYEQGDVIAIEVFEKAIQYWGMAAANLISIFNPQKIVFGGGVFGPASKFLKEIRLEAKKWAQPISIDQVEFHISSLKGGSGILGAAYSALLNLKKK